MNSLAGFTVDNLGRGCAGKFVSMARSGIFEPPDQLSGGQVDAKHCSLLFTSELLAKER
jgi:hypothetical protein